MGAMGEFPVVLKAETLSPLPLPIVVRRQHKCNRSRSSNNAWRLKATATKTQWWRQRREVSSIQEALPLLQRPQHPSPTKESHPYPLLPAIESPTPRKNIDDKHKDDDEEEELEDSTNGVLTTASDVLCLMDSLQLPVDGDLYLSLVRECTDARDAVQGAKVHAHIQQHCGNILRRPSGLLLANRLLLMYAACGHPEIARQVFDEMPVRDAISWATMIAPLSDGGNHREAMQLFVNGWSAGRPADSCFAAAVAMVLRSCMGVRDLRFGQQVHGLMYKMVPDDGNYWQLGSPLIQFYTMLGHYESAQKVFGGTSSHNTAAWTGMITACCRDGGFKEALYTFMEIGRSGGRKNSYIISSILPACARMEDEGWSGRQIHGHAIKAGVDFDQFVGSSLVDMYAKCGRLGDARKAFDVTINSEGTRDSVCWNAMLSGYAQRGCCTEAIRFLYEMKAAGIELQESMLDRVRTACGD